MDEPLHRSRACFVCGTENPGGLGLQPMRDGKKVYVEYRPDVIYRGMSSAIHGGMVATLLDEVVGHAAGVACQGKAATAELTIVYKAPLKVGERVRAEGWYLRKSGRYLLGRGQIIALEGERTGRVLAEARGRFVMVDERLRKRFIE
jgi:acyl-coenzyme A thioesterase PaaI-like protein